MGDFQNSFELKTLRKKLSENKLSQKEFFRLIEIEYIWGIIGDLDKLRAAFDKMRIELGISNHFSLNNLEMPEKLKELINQEAMIQDDLRERRHLLA